MLKIGVQNLAAVSSVVHLYKKNITRMRLRVCLFSATCAAKPETVTRTISCSNTDDFSFEFRTVFELFEKHRTSRRRRIQVLSNQDSRVLKIH